MAKVEPETFEEPDTLQDPPAYNDPPVYTPPECLRFSLVVHQPWFEYTIMSAIGITCVQLALYDPYDEDEDSTRNTVNRYVDYVCLTLFTAELVLKHCAFGVSGFWDEGWNRLDGLVVATGFLSLIPAMSSLVVMKLLRVLRPLRIVNKLAGMKKLIGTLVSSAKPLADTGLLLCVLMFIFGIVGLTMFSGKHPDQKLSRLTEWVCRQPAAAVLPAGEWCCQRDNL
jgi:hypothetical protein